MSSSNNYDQIKNNLMPTNSQSAFGRTSDVPSTFSWDTHLRHDPRDMSINTTADSSQRSTSYRTAHQDVSPTDIPIRRYRTSETETNVTIVSSNHPRTNPCCECCNTCFGNCCYRQSPTSTAVSVNITSQPESEQRNSSNVVRNRNPGHPMTSLHAYSHEECHPTHTTSTNDSHMSTHPSATERTSQNNTTRQVQSVKRMRLVIRENGYTFETIDSVNGSDDGESSIGEPSTGQGVVEEMILSFPRTESDREEEYPGSILDPIGTTSDKQENTDEEGNLVVEEQKDSDIKEDRELALNRSKNNESAVVKDGPQDNPEAEQPQQEPETKTKKVARRLSKMLPKKGRESKESKDGFAGDRTGEVSQPKVKKIAHFFSSLLPNKSNKSPNEEGEKDIGNKKPKENMKSYTGRVREAADEVKDSVKNLLQEMHKGLLIALPCIKKEKNVIVLDSNHSGSQLFDAEPRPSLKTFNETAEKYRKIARQLDLEHQDYEGALRMFERAMDEMKKTKNTANKYYGRILFEYAVTLHKVGRRTESMDNYRKADLAGFASIEHDFSRDLTAVRNAGKKGSATGTAEKRGPAKENPGKSGSVTGNGRSTESP